MGVSKSLWTGSFFAAFNIFNFGSMALIIWAGAELYTNGKL
jgi:hypothetical protein